MAKFQIPMLNLRLPSRVPSIGFSQYAVLRAYFGGRLLRLERNCFGIDKLHRWITSRGKVLQVIRSDNEFTKNVITEWLLHKPGIRLLPSIPYEHDTARTVERANQTMDNTINKMLDLPRNKHLTHQHWAMAFMHALKIKKSITYYGTTWSVPH